MGRLPDIKIVNYEEWLVSPEDKNEEVVDGAIRIRPIGRWNHALIVATVQSAFSRELEEKRFLIATGSFGIVIRTAPLTCRTPDLAIFDNATVVEVDGYLRSAPELAIEVLSPRNPPAEMPRKIIDYCNLGLPELWIFSQDERTVEVLLLEDGRLRRSALISEGRLKPTRIPHVEIEIASIWPA